MGNYLLSIRESILYVLSVVRLSYLQRLNMFAENLGLACTVAILVSDLFVMTVADYLLRINEAIE